MTDIKDIIKSAFPSVELPSNEESDKFAAEAMLKSINPLSITELAGKYREIDATPSIMSQTIDFLLHLNDDIENKFREVLDKRGISEAEWKEFGSVDFLPKARMYKYKGEGIFIISEPDISREELRLDCKVVYGELKQH